MSKKLTLLSVPIDTVDRLLGKAVINRNRPTDYMYTTRIDQYIERSY